MSDHRAIPYATSNIGAGPPGEAPFTRRTALLAVVGVFVVMGALVVFGGWEVALDLFAPDGEVAEISFTLGDGEEVPDLVTISVSNARELSTMTLIPGEPQTGVVNLLGRDQWWNHNGYGVELRTIRGATSPTPGPNAQGR